MAYQVTLRAYLDGIENLIEIDRTDDAITLCKHILHYYPKHIDTYRLMAEAMLKRGDLADAQELFRRVLSADPENVVAYARLATIFEKQHQTDEALWHLERAYELAPTHPEIRIQLLHLYSEIEGKPRERLKLTPGALARLYVQEGLFPQAIQEFRAIASSEPARYDAQIALAESLWRIGHTREATEVAQNLLKILPYCLKANLILGTLWYESELEGSETYLERVQALDPMNQIAQALYGARSPLRYRQVFVPRYVPGATPPPAPQPASPVKAIPSFDEFFPEPTSDTPPMDKPASAETSALELDELFPEKQPESSELTVDDSGLPSWLREDIQIAPQAESPTPELTEELPAESPTPELTEEPPAKSASAPPAELTELPNPLSEMPESEGLIETPTPHLLSRLEEALRVEEDEAAPGAPAVASAETEPASQQEIDRAKEESGAPAESHAAETTQAPAWLEEIDQAKEELNAPVETRAAEPKQAPTWLTEIDRTKEEPAAPAESHAAESTQAPTWLQEIDRTKEELSAPIEDRAAETTQPPARLNEPMARPEPTEEGAVREPPVPSAQAETPKTSAPVAPEKASPEKRTEELKMPAWVRVLTQRPSEKKAAAQPSQPESKQQPEELNRLAQARQYRDANRLGDALAEYDYIVQHAPQWLKDSIDDLEQFIQREDAPLEAHRILGDAYARVDRFVEALERYRFVVDHSSRPADSTS